MYDRFDALDATVIAISQEDEALEAHAKMERQIRPEPRFPILADLNRAETTAYDRATAYLIDKKGIVRQVFPMTVRMRPSWEVVLDEIKRLEASH